MYILESIGTRLELFQPELNDSAGIFFFFFGFSLTSLTRLFHSYRDEPIGRWGKM